MRPRVSLGNESNRDASMICTFPKTSSGKPINAIILLWSDVRSEVGRDRVGARVARGGEPQSSNVCSRPDDRICVDSLDDYTMK